ncbi:bifunctional proline dehydrogenase/L-glutamate gamma-semialdehyde dehydrogenase PutA [Anaplasma centrale]|nr:bifunctional proline dehydrogenase/L-glutamate gamma-semialdehyde dehydrogenase PutA [Anaplasma centrale]
MISSLQSPNELRKRMQGLYNADEKSYTRYLAERTEVSQESKVRIYSLAKQIIERVRASKSATMIDAFMQQYGLSTEEGLALMCLAESLLRIPDDCTIDDMIRDKIARTTWNKHIGRSASIFVNVSTLALSIGAHMLREVDDSRWYGILGNLLKDMGEPVIRKTALQAIQVLGKHYVCGRTIEEAIAKSNENGSLCSFDVLGEAAQTRADADRYFASYMNVLETLGADPKAGAELESRHGISVKLSSLHPRYEFGQADYVLNDISSKLLELCQVAKKHNVRLTIDAEEARRLELSLMILDKVFSDSSLNGWEGLGFVIQAYQKRALAALDFVEDVAIRANRKMVLRLVKGAYWDYEIRNAQEMGLDGYPVFTRRAYTDVSYLACVQRVLSKPGTFYPCFATHNAYTLSFVLEMADKDHPGFEFQRLHGMAQGLYDYVTKEIAPNVRCRVYAPIGQHKELLPYLIRRLIENGANVSFVNMINDADIPAESLCADPLEKAKSFEYMPHPSIPLPSEMFPDGRINSTGVNTSDSLSMLALSEEVSAFDSTSWKAYPIIHGQDIEGGELYEVFSPASLSTKVGEVLFATAEHALQSVDAARSSFHRWSNTPVGERADILEHAADLLEKEGRGKFFSLLIREGGKVIPDAVAEIREAVDFLRYYARLARDQLTDPIKLPGPAGEENYLYFESRGTFVCISPWNFPLAIFLGPIAAALVTGNTVIAKPAEQTSLVAYEAVKLLYEAGVPTDVLHFLPGRGEVLGNALLSSPKIAGVAFTGSTETANIINQVIAGRSHDIIPLIAETGGINAMIVDSSALPEQVVGDVITSAFKSAGQRCSALRALFLQDEIADGVIELLLGAVAELRLGNPMSLSTDIGPVIDQQSLDMLNAYVEEMQKKKIKLLCKADIGYLHGGEEGYFFPPHIFEIESMSQLSREVFGPVLHVIRYKKPDLLNMLDDINSTGYGLTFSIQSRIQSSIDDITDRIGAGNVYVNRHQIGAVPGVQPFGGRGLSGTGPKAGGPYYLHRFLTEKAVTVNAAALGGSVSLVCLEDE